MVNLPVGGLYNAYNALAADLYWIRSIQYYGGTKRRLAESGAGVVPAALSAEATWTLLTPLKPLWKGRLIYRITDFYPEVLLAALGIIPFGNASDITRPVRPPALAGCNPMS